MHSETWEGVVVTSVIMPQMGSDMTAGIIQAWLKREGDTVEKGEPLVQIETEKAVVEIEAPATGIVRVIYASEGSEVPVTEVIAIIADPDEESQ